MSDIYLSPRMILSYLKDLESKVQLTEKQAYVPCDDNNFATDEDLEREAKRILKYVNLVDCVPTCKFEYINNGCAGYTINNSSRYSIPISVNHKYCNNCKACRAILAHEICHKVIYLNGINYEPRFQEYNEIFTDLCTIYIGLGQLVLDGYIDPKTKDLNMGYLKVDMYYETFAIVAKATSKYQLNNNIKISDPLLEDALSIYSTPEDAKKILVQTFEKNEMNLAEVNRNILLLHQILDQVYVKHGDIFRKMSREFVNLGIFNDKLADKPLTLFSGIYESLFERNEQKAFTVAQTDIFNLILSLTNEYEEIDIGKLDYSSLKCPNCGYSTTTKIYDREATVRCPSCGIYFRFCNSLLNITKMRRLQSNLIEERKK